ncbi:hypothetical protein HDU96_005687 [Phlyctochytrium bullatum]|nr:hypothetical protein HDU96_005687 [Phlyctochytrium bullatum]
MIPANDRVLGMRDLHGNTLLRIALMSSKIDMAVIKHLLEKGAPVKNNGDTLLHLAFEKGSREVLKFLLEHGAETAEPDKFGRPVLHRAAFQGRLAELIILLSYGRAKVNGTDSRERTALQVEDTARA